MENLEDRLIDVLDVALQKYATNISKGYQMSDVPLTQWQFELGGKKYNLILGESDE